MLDHNEKLKLVIEFIQSGAKDAEDIIHSIKAIEKKLFKNNELRSLKKTKITGNKETGTYALSKNMH
ncbi:hypothetical protein ACG94V_18340 [Acinetobacter sp. ULE_I001]|uniref:hypothetical protein n=1 Tax=unclassified Acinetobacter TaxID=196816 RepID=UPI003AF85292